jgi:hypothetical protein
LLFISKRESVREKRKGFNRQKSAAGGGWICEQRKRGQGFQFERTVERLIGWEMKGFERLIFWEMIGFVRRGSESWGVCSEREEIVNLEGLWKI